MQPQYQESLSTQRAVGLKGNWDCHTSQDDLIRFPGGAPWLSAAPEGASLSLGTWTPWSHYTFFSNCTKKTWCQEQSSRIKHWVLALLFRFSELTHCRSGLHQRTLGRGKWVPQPAFSTRELTATCRVVKVLTRVRN